MSGDSNGVRLGNMARASRWEFEDVNEQAFVRIARVISQHSFIDVLLGAFALVARGQKSAGRIGGQASLQTSCLRVVMSVDNNTPIAIDITSALGHGIKNLRGAQVAFGTDPVGNIVRAGTFGSAGVVFVVESVLGVLVQMLDQVVGRLVGNIGELFLEKIVLRYSSLDLVFGVLRIFQAVVKASGIGAVRGQFRVTVTFRMVVGSRGSVVRSRGRAVGMIGAWG